MAIRSIAHLKSYFQGIPKTDNPTAGEWTDLIDTIGWYYDMVNAAVAASSPVIIVANEAELLTNGETYAVGRRIKQTDIGKTWVKQQQPGTSLGDYGEIGDTAIVISDVLGLQIQLDRRIVNDGDDASTARLGVRNTFTSVIGTWQMLGGPEEIQADPTGPALNYAVVDVFASFQLDWTGAFPTGEGRSVTGFIHNGAPGNITGTMAGPDMIGTNGEWPVIMLPDTWLMVTFTWVTLPVFGPVVLVAYNDKK